MTESKLSSNQHQRLRVFTPETATNWPRAESDELERTIDFACWFLNNHPEQAGGGETYGIANLCRCLLSENRHRRLLQAAPPDAAGRSAGR